MGAYYSFCMTVERADKELLKEIDDYIRFRLAGTPFEFGAKDEAGYYDSGGDVGEWDDEERFMVALSTEFPTALFTVHWRDEGASHDESMTYWMNGKKQTVYPIVRWPKFDKRKLTKPKRAA